MILRFAGAMVIFFGAILGGFLVYRHMTAGPAVVLPAPQHLEARGNGLPLLPGGWTNASDPVLAVHESSGERAGADVEVVPVGYQFTDAAATITVPTPGIPSTRTGPHSTDVPASIHLADGSYHWRARLHNQRGVSPWVLYPGVLRVDTVPPTRPAVSSPTDPRPGTTYHDGKVTFTWSSFDAGAGIAGYSYRLDTDARGDTKRELRTPNTTVTVNGMHTGTYYFHVRALDRAGNWGPTTTFPVSIDVTPPGLEHVRFSSYHFDPEYTPLNISFTITRAATSVHAGVYDQNTNKLVRFYNLGSLTKGQQTAVNWDGKDAGGSMVPAGTYAVYLRATDQYGHTNLVGWRDFVVDYRRIVISLSQQRLWAYDGQKVLLTSLVTTGNPKLPTPTGTFAIEGKFHPFTFISPWPKSSPFYYPPSPTNYAMLFQEGGYFIHDAPWRNVFGPGSNAQVGTPGSNFTGTHGCVNVPPDVAQRLFDWADVGTVVQINA